MLVLNSCLTRGLTVVFFLLPQLIVTAGVESLHSVLYQLHVFCGPGSRVVAHLNMWLVVSWCFKHKTFSKKAVTGGGLVRTYMTWWVLRAGLAQPEIPEGRVYRGLPWLFTETLPISSPLLLGPLTSHVGIPGGLWVQQTNKTSAELSPVTASENPLAVGFSKSAVPSKTIAARPWLHYSSFASAIALSSKGDYKPNWQAVIYHLFDLMHRNGCVLKSLCFSPPHLLPKSFSMETFSW